MENKVLATVNGIDITDEILDTTIQSLAPERRGYFESEYGRKQLLDQLISVELINAFGTEIGLDNDPQFMSQVEQALKDIKYSFTMNKILSTITIEEDEAKEVYAAHPERYQGQESIKASHILVDDEKIAKDIITKIESSELTFEDAAKEYSSCPSSEQGGDLGEFGRGMMVKEFEDAAFAAEVGHVVGPVKTQFGYHLIKVEDKKEAGESSLEEVKDQIRAELSQKKQEEAYRAKVDELKKKYME